MSSCCTEVSKELFNTEIRMTPVLILIDYPSNSLCDLISFTGFYASDKRLNRESVWYTKTLLNLKSTHTTTFKFWFGLYGGDGLYGGIAL